jgi:hypothetical protein
MLDSWQAVLTLVAAILIAYAVILWLGTIVWVYRDIRDRTRDSWSHTVSILLVLLFNLPGLILYLVLRPRETLIEAYERRLETEALLGEMPDRRLCPGCQRASREEYLLCPYCRTDLRQPCANCNRALELTWVACPYCGGQGPQHLIAPPSVGTAAVKPITGDGAPQAPPAQPAPRATTRRSSP